MTGALTGTRVVDFSTLLPGPLATRMLAEAGAEIIKIERIGGEEMRRWPPFRDGASIPFALLNHGKNPLELNLQDPKDRARALELVRTADVLVEQFRPGVMERLGFGFAALSEINPRLVYCSITGYGQSGKQVHKVGHDLNYLAGAGLLGVVGGDQGEPCLPTTQAADIAGGAYPAVINILLALMQSQRTGRGCHLDIAMADATLTLGWWQFAQGQVDRWPAMNDHLLTGASPRYRLYRTADDRFLAVAPLEQKFWEVFCDAIDLPRVLWDDHIDPVASIEGVARILRSRSAEHWLDALATKDVCCSLVRSAAEVFHDEELRSKGYFRPIPEGRGSLRALPLPLSVAVSASS